MSVNSLWAISLSPMNETTWRWRWRPPFFALVITRSATGRSALALASVVTSASAAISDATRLPNMAFWCEALPPKRRPFFGVATMTASPPVLLLATAQCQAALVELLQHLVERLLPEVGDGQQVLLGLQHQLADGVDLGALEAVARTLGEVQLLDRQVEIRRAAGDRADIAQLQA